MSQVFDVIGFGRQLIPPHRQRPRHMAWVAALLQPVASLNGQFAAWATATRERANVTGQVASLEKFLNDLFDATERRIFISDGQPAVPPFVFNKAENDALLVWNKAENPASPFLNNAAEFADDVDFIVNVPAALPLVPAIVSSIRAAVNLYRPAGRRYSLINF